jgi:gliding motility-associated-like protein
MGNRTFFALWVAVFGWVAGARAQVASDCLGAITICGNQKITFNPAGPGDVLDLRQPGNQPGCLSVGGENASVWYRVVVDRAGTLTFSITPESPSDFDWGMWGPFKPEDRPCQGLGSPVRCNAAAPTTATGLSETSNITAGPPGSSNPWSRALEVQVGEVYYLMVDNWSAGGGRGGGGIRFDLTWGGTAQLASFYGDFAYQQQCLRVDFRSTAISCQGNLTYSWSFGDGSPSAVSPTPSHTYARGGTYSVIMNVSSPSGDGGGVGKTLVVDPSRSSSQTVAFAYQKKCAEVSFQPEVTGFCEGQLGYTWDFGDGSPPSRAPAPTHLYARGGTYTVGLTVSLGGASRSFSAPVTIVAGPAFGIRSDSLFCLARGEAVLEATPGFANYQWSFGQPGGWSAPSPSPRFTARQAGSYWVRAVDGRGCPVAAQVALADCCPAEVVLPSAFTPRSSAGANDGYRPQAENVRAYLLQVFDRWGSLVFQTDDPAQAWDGTFRGQPAPAGAYQAVAEFWGCTGKRRRSQVVQLID